MHLKTQSRNIFPEFTISVSTLVPPVYLSPGITLSSCQKGLEILACCDSGACRQLGFSTASKHKLLCTPDCQHLCGSCSTYLSSYYSSSVFSMPDLRYVQKASVCTEIYCRDIQLVLTHSQCSLPGTRSLQLHAAGKQPCNFLGQACPGKTVRAALDCNKSIILFNALMHCLYTYGTDNPHQHSVVKSHWELTQATVE